MTIIRKNSLRRLRKLIVLAGSVPAREGDPRTCTVRRGLPSAALGAIAQLGERLDRTQEVGGSSPPSSTSPGAPAGTGVSSVGPHEVSPPRRQTTRRSGAARA